MQINDTWTMVQIDGAKILQLTTDGYVIAVMQDTLPAEGATGLRLYNGWTEKVFGLPIRTFFMRQGPNTSHAELHVGDWVM